MEAYNELDLQRWLIIDISMGGTDAHLSKEGRHLIQVNTSYYHILVCESKRSYIGRILGPELLFEHIPSSRGLPLGERSNA